MVPFLFSTYPAGEVVSGQQAATTTEAALPDVSVRWVVIKAHDANAIPLYLGPAGVTASTGLELGPGDSVSMHIRNTNLLSVITGGVGSAGVSWFAEVL